MNYIFPGTLLLILSLATSAHAHIYTVTTDKGGVTETYLADMNTGELTFTSGEETLKFSDVVGDAGQTSRALVSFNGAAALTYENSGSNTSFEIFYTLVSADKTPVIDCVYANIRNGQNGVSIRKAICNLDIPLSSDYQDLIFTYSDKWLDGSNALPLQPVMAESSRPAYAPVDRLGDVEVSLRYDSLEELMSATPKTIATTGTTVYEVSDGKAYLVYGADGITPMALDVETNPFTHELQRLTPADLTSVVEALGNDSKE